ncbi:MAG: ribosomal protein S18-alanine N-acetyltransferase [Tissierellia bacterium]|nr:ribosomal protein S18-alanine N-acetyltransferase [Tissierellia bacterium]
MLEIKIAQKRDAHELYKLECECFEHPWSEENFKNDLLNNPLANYFIAISDEKIVAFAAIWYILDEVHIANFCVKPDYRKKGIGKKLLNHIILDAKQRNFMGITLEVNEKNEAAINLYLAEGFVAYGFRPGYYSETKDAAIIMWKFFEGE